MTHTLTEFALALYAAPGVEAECLQWQDGAQRSVPLLLCCAWLDAGGGCDAAQLEGLAGPAIDWERRVVWPVRQLRRQLKALATTDADARAIRDRLKATELAAELALLSRLAALPWQPSTQSALASLLRLYQLPDDCDPFPALRRAMAKIASGSLTGPVN